MEVATNAFKESHGLKEMLSWQEEGLIIRDPRYSSPPSPAIDSSVHIDIRHAP